MHRRPLTALPINRRKICIRLLIGFAAVCFVVVGASLLSRIVRSPAVVPVAIPGQQHNSAAQKHSPRLHQQAADPIPPLSSPVTTSAAAPTTAAPTTSTSPPTSPPTTTSITTTTTIATSNAPPETSAAPTTTEARPETTAAPSTPDVIATAASPVAANQSAATFGSVSSAADPHETVFTLKKHHPKSKWEPNPAAGNGSSSEDYPVTEASAPTLAPSDNPPESSSGGSSSSGGGAGSHGSHGHRQHQDSVARGKHDDAGSSAATIKNFEGPSNDDTQQSKEKKQNQRVTNSDAGTTTTATTTPALAPAHHVDPELSTVPFDVALNEYKSLLSVDLDHFEHKKMNKKHLQETASYIDIREKPGQGALLPHSADDDLEQSEHEPLWRACDTTSSDFTTQRDERCSAYLRNWNNIRSIKAMGAKLLNGRTIKYRVFYRHGNITAIIKVSQHKFAFEPISEALSFGVERALGWQYIPPTVWMPLPLQFMEAAAGLADALYAQWLRQFVVDFRFLRDRFYFPCADAPVAHESKLGRMMSLSSDGKTVRSASAKDDLSSDGLCANVTVQLWMEDVHPALYTYLAVNYDADEYFFRHFYVPREGRAFPPRPHRLQALGDLCDRFIFDFITGNTDRGMNDHNNFVYGGCDPRHGTACEAPASAWQRHRGEAKYAFLDQGSAFYSHKEPENSPFAGNRTKRMHICRFRRSTYKGLRKFQRTEHQIHHHAMPLPLAALELVPGHHTMFDLVHRSVFYMVQERLEKIVRIIEDCFDEFSEKEVLVL